MPVKNVDQNGLDAVGLNRRAIVMTAGAALMSPLLNVGTATASPGPQDVKFEPEKIKAIVFDTVGTLVDPYGTIVDRASQITRARGVDANWDQLYGRWSSEWRSQLNEIIAGTITWRSSDIIFRDALNKILASFEWGAKITEGDREQINRLWYELKPWDDTKPGLERLRNRYTLSTLSNNSMASLISFAKRDKLPFDCILTAELVQSGKPDPKVYALAARSLNLRPDQILMVAAHKYDLAAAKKFGFSVAFIPRPLENGPNGKYDSTSEDYYALTQPDLIHLAEALGT